MIWSVVYWFVAQGVHEVDPKVIIDPTVVHMREQFNCTTVSFKFKLPAPVKFSNLNVGLNFDSNTLHVCKQVISCTASFKLPDPMRFSNLNFGESLDSNAAHVCKQFVCCTAVLTFVPIRFSNLNRLPYDAPKLVQELLAS